MTGFSPSIDDWVLIERDGTEYKISYLELIQEYLSRIDPKYPAPSPSKLLNSDKLLINRNGETYKVAWEQVIPEIVTVTNPPPPPVSSTVDINLLAPEIWFDAADLDTITYDDLNQNRVSQWNNKGSNGAASNATSPLLNRPRLVFNEQNNLPGIWFDSGSDGAGTGTATFMDGAWTHNTQEGTIIMCMKVWGGMIDTSGAANSPAEYQSCYRFSFGSTSLQRWEPLTGAGELRSLGGALANNPVSIYESTARVKSWIDDVEVVGSVLSSNNNSLFVFVNDNQSPVIEPNVTQNFTTFRIMNAASYAERQTFGVVYEILGWDRALSPTELNEVREYLYAKWQVSNAFGRPQYIWSPNPISRLQDSDIFYVERADGVGYKITWEEFRPGILHTRIYNYNPQDLVIQYTEPGDQLIVDWGDGTIEEYGLNKPSLLSHSYADNGLYDVVFFTRTKQGTVLGEGGNNSVFATAKWVTIELFYEFTARYLLLSEAYTENLNGNPTTVNGARMFVEINGRPFGWSEFEALNDDFEGPNNSRSRQIGMFSCTPCLPNLGVFDTNQNPNFTVDTTVDSLFRSAWSLPEMPFINLNGAQQARDAFANNLYPSIRTDLDYSTLTNCDGIWRNSLRITEFPSLTLPAATRLEGAWRGNNRTVSVGTITAPNVTTLRRAFESNTALESIEALNLGLVTNIEAAWNRCFALSTIPDTLNLSACTDADGAFASTSFNSFPTNYTLSNVASWNGTFGGVNWPVSLLGNIDFSSATNFSNMFSGATLTGESLDISKFTAVNCVITHRMFRQANILEGLTGSVTFPAVTNAFEMLYGVSPAQAMPVVNLPAVTNMQRFATSSDFTSIPAFTLNPSVTNCSSWFEGANNFSSFPFSILSGTTCVNFNRGWVNCALDVTSVDGILSTINASGTSNGTIGFNGGTSASPTGGVANPDVVALASRGWTIVFN